MSVLCQRLGIAAFVAVLALPGAAQTTAAPAPVGVAPASRPMVRPPGQSRPPGGSADSPQRRQPEHPQRPPRRNEHPRGVSLHNPEGRGHEPVNGVSTVRTGIPAPSAAPAATVVPAGPQAATGAVNAQVTPAQPSRPFEKSPVPPQVTYAGGLLTISAPNSTLSDILNAVKARTGAKLEMAPGTAQERVAVQLGPGNPRDVLAQLLHGSPFDYIVLGSTQDSNAVTQITVTRREGGATTTAAAGTQNPAPRQPEPAEDEADNEPQPPQPTPAEAGTAAPPAAVQPGLPAPGQLPPDQNAPSGQANPTAQPGQEGPKTPEQLLQELQRMQQQEQQRRQQQQQRPPP